MGPAHQENGDSTRLSLGSRISAGGADPVRVFRQPEVDGGYERHTGLEPGVAYLDAGFAAPHPSTRGDGLENQWAQENQWGQVSILLD